MSFPNLGRKGEELWVLGWGQRRAKAGVEEAVGKITPIRNPGGTSEASLLCQGHLQGLSVSFHTAPRAAPAQPPQHFWPPCTPSPLRLLPLPDHVQPPPYYLWWLVAASPPQNPSHQGWAIALQNQHTHHLQHHLVTVSRGALTAMPPKRSQTQLCWGEKVFRMGVPSPLPALTLFCISVQPKELE